MIKFVRSNPNRKIMKFLKFIFTILFLWQSWSLAYGQDHLHSYNCYSILAGREATADSSVMFAHEEDDYGEQMVYWYKMPDIRAHNEEDSITLKNGARLPQAEQTYGYYWLEMPGMDFSDTYMNRFGVTISSDQCLSKVEDAELKDGGIGYWLRRLMAERASTAREAVKIGGELVEEFGYYASGRTYCIADPNEAWMMAVVKGKLWVAQRIPDDHVAIIPNFYTITHINLKDTANFLGTPDIYEYAIQQGWYDPNKDVEFNFRDIYSRDYVLEDSSNIARMWRGLNLLSDEKFRFDEPFPFSFKPAEKITLDMMMAVMEDHYEGTFLDHPSHVEVNPHHREIMTICSNTNQYGFIAQLRNYLPKELGNVLWLAPRRPCIQPFIPWYWGLFEIPQVFRSDLDREIAVNYHFAEKQREGSVFGVFDQYADNIDENYAELYEKAIIKKAEFESELFEELPEVENNAEKMLKMNKIQGMIILTKFMEKWMKKSYQYKDW